MKSSLRQTATAQHQSRPRGNDRAKTPSSGQHPRRRFLGLAAGAAALPAVSRIAMAQTYPTRPITMIVPQAPGGALDTVGRIFAERMRGSLGQPIIIENVAGADGNIGTGRAARARPDGYTIINGSVSTHALNGALYSLPYDLLNDFAPISLLTKGPFGLFAKRTMPAKDFSASDRHELDNAVSAAPLESGGARSTLCTLQFNRECSLPSLFYGAGLVDSVPGSQGPEAPSPPLR
jgi:tripartite-type tricarboxylate transporter receptor subunit TctC